MPPDPLSALGRALGNFLAPILSPIIERAVENVLNKMFGPDTAEDAVTRPDLRAALLKRVQLQSNSDGVRPAERTDEAGPTP